MALAIAAALLAGFFYGVWFANVMNKQEAPCTR